MPTTLDSSHPYPIRVLGRIVVRPAHDQPAQVLGGSRRTLLALLVLAGDVGVHASDLPPARGRRTPRDNGALRVAIGRLRPLLPPGALPTAVDGRYRLALAADDVDHWHLRRLAVDGDLTAVPDDRLVHLLTPHLPTLDGETDHADDVPRMQEALLLRLTDEQPDRITAALTDVLLAQVAVHPHHERLVALTARCLARAGDRPRALAVIDDSVTALHARGLAVSPALRAVQSSIFDGHDVDIGVAPEATTAIAHRVETGVDDLPPTVPQALRHLERSPLIGRDAVVDALVAARASAAISVVTGPAGSGLTRLCAEYARRIVDAGGRVRYVACLPSGEAAFGPIVAAVPELADEIANVTSAGAGERGGDGTDDDPSVRRALAWATIGRRLDVHVGAGGSLVIDDCQWLDSATTDFLSHAARLSGRTWSIVLAGTDESRSIVQRYTAGGAAHHRLTPLTPPETHRLVLAVRGDLSGRRAWGIARELHLSCRGWPGPILALLAAGDEALADPDTAGRSAEEWFDRIVRSLETLPRHLGEILSAAESSLELDTLAKASDHDVDDVIDALDKLVRDGLVNELGIDEFVVADAAVRMAFRRATLARRWAEHHERLADLCDDPHRRAPHLLAAVPRVAAHVAERALLHSARTFSANGDHHEAAKRFGRARALGATAWPVDDLVAATRSFDLAGLPSLADELRDEYVPVLLDARDAAGALRVVTSGLPEAEPIGGSSRLLERLCSIPADELDQRGRWMLSAHLARQHGIAGGLDAAADRCEDAHRLAADDDQRFVSIVLERWLDGGRSAPEARLALLDRTADLELGVPATAERLVLLAVDGYEAGDLALAADAVERLRAMGTSCPPVRQWHLALFDAVLAADAGRLAEAAAMRLRAHQLGSSFGLVEADVAFRGAEFVITRLFAAAPGRTRPAAGERRTSVDASMLISSPLAAAATALRLADRGDLDAAGALAEAVTRDVLDRPVSGGLAAIALVSGLLPRGALADRAASTFEPRRDSLLLVGAGAASLGPVAQFLVPLAADATERRALRRLAVDVADRCGALLWRAITRRDLLAADDPIDPDRRAVVRRELDALVAGTELEPLITGRH
ncbi:MAG: BTAD domain-containing putative transcriptional regulator [Ilumatobacteraceae bacterium]